MGSNKDSTINQTLSDICDDLFSLVVYLREAGDIADPDVLYDRAMELFTALEERARQVKIPDVDIRDAKYALVAIIDETVGWASRLEQHFFSQNVAGEGFFSRLEEIKATKGRNDVLAVYYLCLTLGFEGRLFRFPEQIREHIAQLREILNVKETSRLSPRGERSQETIKRRGGGIGAWVPWAVTAAGIVIVVGIVVLLRIRIGGWASGAVRQIQRLLG